MEWYYQENGETRGPVNDEEIKQLVRDCKLGRKDMVKNEKTRNMWVPVYQMPLLFPLLPVVKDPKIDQELQRRKEQADQERKKHKITGTLVTACVVAVLILAIATPIYLRITTPSRERGISSSNPIGRFDKLDGYFTKELQMDRNEVAKCPGIKRTAPKIYAYTNPKAPRGASVSGAGTIFLLVDGDKLTGLSVSFTSSGPRGVGIFNNCVAGVWGKETWFLLEPKDPPTRHDPKFWPAGTWERTALSDELPKDGGLSFHDGEKTIGCWYESGAHGLDALIYFEPKMAK